MMLRALVIVLMLGGFVAAEAAGRARQCRRTCRDVIASECGTRLGLSRPDRVCKKALLRRCKREGVGVCSYPNIVGGWQFDIAQCRQQCGDDPEEDCPTRVTFFTFLQHGTRIEENVRAMTGWFVDHATFQLDTTSVIGDTASLRGTWVDSNRITNVTYEIVVDSEELGLCRRTQVGELVH